MNRAQTAFALLAGLFLLAATVVFCVDDNTVPAYIMLGLASVGFLSLGGMIFYDARDPRTPTPTRDGGATSG